jgi:hypothetical protein
VILERPTVRLTQTQLSKIALVIRVLTWLAFLVSAGMIVLLPLPLSHVESPGRLYAPQTFNEPARIPGTSLKVTRHAHGISVEADDGGGAGLILLPANVLLNERSLLSIERRSSSLTVVRVKPEPAREAVFFARVDDNGVRQDDSFVDRIAARTLRITLLMMFLAFLIVSGVNSSRRRA